MKRFALSTAAAASTALLMAVPAFAAAGWTVVPSPAPGTTSTLNGVFSRTATDAWAVGSNPSGIRHVGTVMLTEHWDGKAWKAVPNTGIQFHDENLRGVGASAADDAWAVGFTRVTGNYSTAQLTAHWDGTAWSVVPTSASGTRDQLFGVVDFSRTNAYAAGIGNNQADVEHWDGSSWQPAKLPPLGPTGSTSTLVGISASGPNDIWAIGTVSDPTGPANRFLDIAVHFDGSSWTVRQTVAVATPHVVSAISAYGPNDVWVVGNTIKTDGTGAADKPLIEHWNGSAWSLVTASATSAEPTLTSVAAVSPTDVWAVGHSVSLTGQIPVAKTLTLHWDGTAWSEVPSPNVGTGDNLLNGVASGGGELWAVGSGSSQALVLHNG